MNNIDNLINKSLYKPTDGFRFSNATGDNLTLQGKYALDGELKSKLQARKQKLIDDIKAKQDLIEGWKVKYDTSESARSDAQSKYDEANGRNPKKQADKNKKTADKTYFAGKVSEYTTSRDNANNQIKKIGDDIVTLQTNAQKDLDDLTQQQNELATSINKELSDLQAKAQKDNDTKLQGQISGLKPVDKVDSPNVSGRSTGNTAISSITKSKSKTYIYIGVGLAVIVGGYFLIRKRRNK